MSDLPFSGGALIKTTVPNSCRDFTTDTINETIIDTEVQSNPRCTDPDWRVSLHPTKSKRVSSNIRSNKTRLKFYIQTEPQYSSPGPSVYLDPNKQILSLSINWSLFFNECEVEGSQSGFVWILNQVYWSNATAHFNVTWWERLQAEGFSRCSGNRRLWFKSERV